MPQDRLMRPIIDKLKSVFKISHDEDDDAFNYVGMQISQDKDFNIHINQTSYVESIRPIALCQERMTSTQSSLSNDETTLLRGALGQLNWLANMTRPDISFMVSKLSSNVTQATIADVKDANKVIKFVKDTPSKLTFPSLASSSTEIVT